MKKVNLSLFLLMLLVILGCERSYYFKDTSSTDLSNENIGGIRLGMNIEDEKFIKQYSKPKEVKKDHDEYDYNYYENVAIATKKSTNDITRIIISDETMKTAKGISYGSSIADVIKAYGDNYYKRVEQGVDIIGYYDEKNQYTLEFWHYEDEIVYIRFDLISMK